MYELNVIEKKLPVTKVGFERWRPLDEPFVKINFDPAFHVLTSNSVGLCG